MINTSLFWEELVKYVNINCFDSLESFKITLLILVYIPIKKFFGYSIALVYFLLTIIGWYFGKFKLALLCLLMSIFIVTTGLWEKAMITLYLCGSSVIIASIIGIPLGVWAGLNDRANKILTRLY